MINDDILIKYARSRGHKEDWPDQVKLMRKRILECKLGFPGLGDDHLTLLPINKINFEKDIWIYDPFLETERTKDWAPVMLSPCSQYPGKFRVEGIGNLMDLDRDPDRILIRWRDIVDLPPIESQEMLAIKVDVRPTLTGGPGYYYFFRSLRDLRP